MKKQQTMMNMTEMYMCSMCKFFYADNSGMLSVTDRAE